MKSFLEAQRAHDILLAIRLGEVPDPIGFSNHALHAALNVLCWVLEHEHNAAFSEDLERIEEALTAAGYVLLKEGPSG